MITAKRKEIFKAIFADLKLHQAEISRITGKAESQITKYLSDKYELAPPEPFLNLMAEKFNFSLTDYMKYPPIIYPNNEVNDDPVTNTLTMTEIEYLKRENELLRKNEMLAAENRKLLIEKAERLEKERLGSPNNN